MPIRIIPTKLYPPKAADLVPRPLLMKKLHKGINGKVTIISAPPGFGKSTLLAAWLSEEETKRVAWYSLDEDDNEISRFFGYIATSLHQLGNVTIPLLDAFLETVDPKPRELTGALINDLSDHIQYHFVLVLDDYHQITLQPIHESLTYLIDHLPANLHLVFVSRTDPPLPLGRWRVQGQLTEIRADDLRFNEDESRKYLNQIMGLALCENDILKLETRTEGWVAGLQLAALSLQRTSNHTEVISAFAGSNRYIAEYLTDEVLSNKTESIRNFLLQTSILDRFSAELCNDILGINDSEMLISEIERSNLFIIALDSESKWYRYHRLFADLLKRRLYQSPFDVKDIQRRAAKWFEENNYFLDAIRHWIFAEETANVASVVEHAINEMWGQSEMAILMKRVETIPESVLVEFPSLCAILGWSWIWLGYSSERIFPLLDRAEQKIKGEISSLGRLNVVRSTLYRVSQNDSGKSFQLANLALNQLAPTDFLWRSFAQLEIAISIHATGRPLAEAEKAYTEAILLCEQAGNRNTAWIAACARVQVVTERGDLGRAFTLNSQLLDSVWKGGSSLVHGWAHINQATLLYQINDLIAAERETNLTIELERKSGGMPDVGMRLHALLTKLEQSKGDETRARKAAEEFIELAKRSGITNALDWSRSVHAELMFRLEDWEAFDSWAQTYSSPQQPLFFPYRLSTLMYIRHLIRQKDWDKSRCLLKAQIHLAQEKGYIEYEMELYILLAILEKESGKSNESLQTMISALRIGASGGYIRKFVDEGEVLRTLLIQSQRQVSDDSLRTYISKLLSVFNPHDEVDQSSLIEPLTVREIEVLKLISEGFSNPEIAEKLFLSVGTVKTHVKHIYGKLGVEDRVNASGKARELGITK